MGFCSRSMLQAHFARASTHEGAFSSSLNLPRDFAPKYLTGWISWSILRGGNSAPEDEVYPWNRWYTRRSFVPEACPWSMLREQNPSCVSAFTCTSMFWLPSSWYLFLDDTRFHCMSVMFNFAYYSHWNLTCWNYFRWQRKSQFRKKTTTTTNTWLFKVTIKQQSEVNFENLFIFVLSSVCEILA